MGFSLGCFGVFEIDLNVLQSFIANYAVIVE
ncbi:hypothetical protein T11_13981 [Trichinella zimbabwensis]|uniref:Uncharacterized protein n=1 Tax=Trichinella zimbabwensis TaxID=268475 RepID=A0A0V1GJU8_9BILA|nr:hypothetical protein T11_13981 [Trichinella zimbabwensis]